MKAPTTRIFARRPSRVPAFIPGSYLTDGRRLFRVVSQFTPSAERVFASLEDCFTLEVSDYAPGELYSMGLRTVRTA